MPELARRLLAYVGLGVLYVLAFPFFLPSLIRRLRAHLALRKALNDGWKECRTCHTRTPTVGQATCRMCGFTEMGSLLYCTNCKRVVADSVTCIGCKNSVKVRE